MVALTFDDGPDAEHTPRLLELLGERGVRATFFVFGDKARRHPELIARALADGHTVEPHCWAAHESHHRLAEGELDEEIGRTLEALASLGCPRPHLWRPPYGDIRAPVSYDVAARHGLRLVTWTLDTRDWDVEHPRPRGEIEAELDADSVVLMHDPMPATAELAGWLVDRVEAAGHGTGPIEPGSPAFVTGGRHTGGDPD